MVWPKKFSSYCIAFLFSKSDFEEQLIILLDPVFFCQFLVMGRKLGLEVLVVGNGIPCSSLDACLN
jgi:hypothetical protein